MSLLKAAVLEGWGNGAGWQRLQVCFVSFSLNGGIRSGTLFWTFMVDPDVGMITETGEMPSYPTT